MIVLAMHLKNYDPSVADSSSWSVVNYCIGIKVTDGLSSVP